MIGRMIDINYHVITDAGRAPPRDDFDSFTELAKLRVLPPAFASQIAQDSATGSSTNTTRSILGGFTRACWQPSATSPNTSGSSETTSRACRSRGLGAVVR